VLIEVLELKAATNWCENNSIPNTSADLLDSSFLPRWTIDQNHKIKQLDKIKVLCVKNTVVYTCNQYRCMIFCSKKQGSSVPNPLGYTLSLMFGYFFAPALDQRFPLGQFAIAEVMWKHQLSYPAHLSIEHLYYEHITQVKF